ncbi:MAG: DUF1577 domain-containing protein [Leptospiraceae bacterium]|nr:DUF1577 domain-containing protein [Leptospiraceae bacterium]
MTKKQSFQEIEKQLQKEIIKILKKEHDPPEKHTILGNNLNEIRHILYYLKSKKVPIYIYYLVDTFTGFILDVEDIFVKVQVLGFEETSFRRCRIAFNFMNVFYQFEVSIYRVDKDIITIYTPLYIQYTTKRKFPRYTTHNLYANINIVYYQLFSHHEYENILKHHFPKIIEELQKDLPDLSMILRVMLQELEKISDTYEIHFFSIETLKSLDWRIKQMKSIQKTIYIENTDSIRSYYAPINNPSITNFERFYRNMLKTNSEEDVLRFFENLMREDKRNQKNSYVYAPIFLFDEIIGYIYTETSYIERKKIFLDDAIKIHILSKVLSYTINRIIFYKGFYETSSALVKNISLSGILLNITSQYIYNYLIGNDLLKIELELFNQKAKFLGMITRMFTLGEKNYNIALEFVEFFDDSFKILENFIFHLQKQELKKGASAP